MILETHKILHSDCGLYIASLGMVKMEALNILILCLKLLEMVLLITLVALFLPWHACLNLKIDFYVTANSSLKIVLCRRATAMVW